MLKSEKGITFLVCVITIIVLIIIGTAVASAGISTYKNSKVKVFVSEMKMIQEKINLYTDRAEVDSSKDITALGCSVTDEEQASRAFNDINYKKIFKKEAQTQAEKDFREGIKFLCMAIQNFRNDKVHTLSREIDKNIAMHYISLTSLAYYLLIKYSNQKQEIPLNSRQ